MPATKKRRTTKAPKRLSKHARLQELKAYVSLCFTMLSDLTHREVAMKTGLCPSTVSRLWHGEFTLRTTFGSVQALGYAAGMRLELTEYDVTVSLVD